MKSFLIMFQSVLLFTLFDSLLAQFQVSPMLIETFVNKNESSISSIDVKNNKNKPIQLSIYLKDKAYINGREVEALPGTSENSCAEMLFLTPSTLDLGPKESTSIRINITIPDTLIGTCWSSIFIEETSDPTPQIHEIEGHKFSLSVNMRVGLSFIQTVPGTTIRSGLIESIDLVYNDDSTAGFIKFNYFNDGNGITKCKGWVEFRDIDGLTVKKIEIDETPKIYPLERKTFSIELPKDLISGEYSALAIIDYGGAQLVAGEVVFEYSNPNE